ncbi:hypothetical protein K402DRAFT_418472 [Aulographum hederae CBS 113979]|uniref:DUF4219 domain-containing protein n=1 Tax=Aulographum hederae CBS 113979 TaxID=1176131 RepID=A0A6G1H980_9PEZI|nr:hypothetical protein K402DRAFT_418472 [Aulographum hederae CBS 113979]
MFHSAVPSRFPAVQMVPEKLQGKLEYKSWATNIEAIAQSLDLWGIIAEDDESPPAQHKQYARSLLVLNVSPSIQMELQGMNAAEIWQHLERQYGLNGFTELSQAIRTLRRVKVTEFDSDPNLSKFYRTFKDAQTLSREIAGAPIPDLTMTAILLDIIWETHEDLAFQIDSHMNNPNTPTSQKTFEYTFSRLRAEYTRQRANHYWSTAAVGESFASSETIQSIFSQLLQVTRFAYNLLHILQ